MPEEHTRLVITVLLANHADHQHCYDFPVGATTEQMLNVAAGVRRLAETLEKQLPLFLINPVISYQAAEVVGVKLAAVGEQQLQKTIEDQQRRAGRFVRS